MTVQTDQGWNVYHQAANKGYLQIMMALIESNCDLINEMNNAKETPLNIASNRGHKSITYIIESAQLIKK